MKCLNPNQETLSLLHNGAMAVPSQILRPTNTLAFYKKRFYNIEALSANLSELIVKKQLKKKLSKEKYTKSRIPWAFVITQCQQ